MGRGKPPSRRICEITHINDEKKERLVRVAPLICRWMCGGLDVPNEVHGAPGETGTECGQHQTIAFFELAFVFVEAQRN